MSHGQRQDHEACSKCALGHEMQPQIRRKRGLVQMGAGRRSMGALTCFDEGDATSLAYLLGLAH